MTNQQPQGGLVKVQLKDTTPLQTNNAEKINSVEALSRKMSLEMRV
jgi:hypothetical protein